MSEENRFNAEDPSQHVGDTGNPEDSQGLGLDPEVLNPLGNPIPSPWGNPQGVPTPDHNPFIEDLFPKLNPDPPMEYTPNWEYNPLPKDINIPPDPDDGTITIPEDDSYYTWETPIDDDGTRGEPGEGEWVDPIE